MSKHWEHCRACHLQRNFWQRKDKKAPFQERNGMRNGSRIMWQEKPLLQECKFQRPRWWLCNSGKIGLLLKMWGWERESSNWCLETWSMLSKTVNEIMQVPIMSWIGNTRKIISKMSIGPESALKPPRHSRRPHQCFQVFPDASRPPWWYGKISRTLQVHSAVLLNAPAGMVVHSGCFKI